VRSLSALRSSAFTTGHASASQRVSRITHGVAEQRVAARAVVLARAYAAHPERFPAGQPHPPTRPVEVWINPPKTRATEEALLH
jgi:hypothetical protein